MAGTCCGSPLGNLLGGAVCWASPLHAAEPEKTQSFLTIRPIYIITSVVKLRSFTTFTENRHTGGGGSDEARAYRGMALLYDFYGDMLTDRQKEFYDLYYNEDLPAEIAENYGITSARASGM